MTPESNSAKTLAENAKVLKQDILKNTEPVLKVVRDESPDTKLPAYESQGLYWKPDGTFNPLLEKMDEISKEETMAKNAQEKKFEEVKARIEERLTKRDQQESVNKEKEAERPVSKSRTVFNGFETNQKTIVPNYFPEVKDSRTFAPMDHKEKAVLPDVEVVPLPKAVPVIEKPKVIPVVEKKAVETAPVIEKKEAPKAVVEKPAPVIEPKPVMKPAEAFTRPVEVPKAPEQNLSPEERKTLDGLVEFNLGKLGIIDTSDPTKLGESKQAAMEQIRLAVPNFFALSVPQQLYAIEKLAQKKSHDLDVNTANRVKEEDATKKGFFGRLKNGMNRSYRLGKYRKEELEKIKKGGLASYQQDLEGITDFVKARGKDIAMTEKGMVIKFMDREPENEGHKKLLAEFNMAATALAETPYKKTLKGKDSKLQKAYEKARENLVNYETKNPKDAETNKLKHLEILNADEDIRMNQALTYNIDTTSRVGRIIKDWKLADKAAYGVAGWVARGVGKYALGVGGGAIASVGIGGIRGYFAKKQELENLADQKRHGVEINAKGVKEVIDAEGYASKIQKLVENIEKTKDPSKKEALLQSLQTRIMVAHERDELGLVNFGKTNKEFKTKDAFFRSMKEANRVLVMNDPTVMKSSEAVMARLQTLYFKDDIKDLEKSKEIRTAVLKGMLAGGGFFLGGAIARDMIFHDGEMTKGTIKYLAEEGKKVLAGMDQIDSYMKGAESDLIEKSNAGFTAVGKAGVDMIRGNSAINDEVTGIKKGMPDFQKLKITTEHMPNLGGAKLEQTFSMVGSRGAIGAIEDLQDKIHARYGDNAPESLKAFLAQKPEKLAQEWGFYRPGEDAESAVILKGAKFGVTNEGQITFENSDGQAVKLGGAEKFAGKMFDAGHTETPTTISPSADDAIPKAGFEDVSDAPSGGGPEVAGFDDSAMNRAPVAVTGMTAPTEGWPSTPAGSAGAPELAPNNFEFNTPDIKGSLVIKEDDFGRVTRVEWAPQSRIEEVRQFMATPDKFLVSAEELKNSGLKFPTRSYGTYELSTASKADGIEYLKMRAALRSGKFAPGTSGYNYIVGQMRLYAASIEGKSGAIFRPAHEDGILKGLKAPRVENIAPVSSAPNIIKPEISKPIEMPKAEMPSASILHPEMKLSYAKDFNSDVLKGHLEFYENADGKITGLDYEKIQSPYYRMWRNFGVANWEAGKSAVERMKINANLKEFVGLNTLLKFGALDDKYEKIIEKRIGLILKNYGEYIDSKHFDEIAKGIKAQS